MNPTPAQTRIMKDRLLTNIVNLPNMLSVKYGAILLGIWGAWSAVPKDSQDALIASLNIPTGWLPALTFLGLLITRVWPQLNTPAPPAEPPVLTDVVPDTIPIAAPPANDDAIEQAMRLIYGDRMTEREIERVKATIALIRQASSTTKGNA